MAACNGGVDTLMFSAVVKEKHAAIFFFFFFPASRDACDCGSRRRPAGSDKPYT